MTGEDWAWRKSAFHLCVLLSQAFFNILSVEQEMVWNQVEEQDSTLEACDDREGAWWLVHLVL